MNRFSQQLVKIIVVFQYRLLLQITSIKRPSPEPADQTLTKAQKKPKVQKKKKKRDPNEPQK